VLLVRRAHPPLRGRWSFPGGRVEWGETLADAVVREVWEETGVRIRTVEPLVTVEHIEGAGSTATHHWVIVDFLCQAGEGEARAASDAEEVAWVPPDELEGYNLPPLVREVLSKGTVRRAELGLGEETLS
jgi:8-oxo-dGTP diphosphatase